MKNLTTGQEVKSLKGQVKKGDLLRLLVAGKKTMAYIINTTDRSIQVNLTYWHKQDRLSFEYTTKFSNKGNMYLGGSNKGNEWIKEENKVLGFINL
jgi:hypothetical protein